VRRMDSMGTQVEGIQHEVGHAPAAMHAEGEAPVWEHTTWWAKALLLVIVILPVVALGIAATLFFNNGVSALDLILFGSMYIATTLGIGMGFHRMLTHRGFTGPAWLRFTVLALGSMALEGPAVWWSATHLKHHARSDRDGDPHSPLDGFWHAHIGWLFRNSEPLEPVFLRPFAGDRVAQLVSKTFPLWAVLGFLIPTAIGFALGGWTGAWTGLLWGGLVRVFFNHHVTWSVNSVCHTFGRQPFKTPDRSRNEWVVGLLALGEGWHNNHHAYPQSAVHGLRWYQFDLSGLIIRGLAKVGLVRKVVIVPKSQWRADLMRARMERLARKRQRQGPHQAPASSPKAS
jgi:stearoyl-CoA desaturase (Delta-9 desaturase)